MESFRHLMYTGGWKKFEGLWNLIIKTGQIGRMRHLLESVLSGFHSDNTYSIGSTDSIALQRSFDPDHRTAP